MANGGRESDPLKAVFGNPAQPLKPDCQLDASAVMGELMNLVDDDVPDRFQVTLHNLARKNCLEGLRSGNQNVGGSRGLLAPFGWGSIAMSHRHGEFRSVNKMSKALDHVSIQGAQRCHVYSSNT